MLDLEAQSRLLLDIPYGLVQVKRVLNLEVRQTRCGEAHHCRSIRSPIVRLPTPALVRFFSSGDAISFGRAALPGASGTSSSRFDEFLHVNLQLEGGGLLDPPSLNGVCVGFLQEYELAELGAFS